MPFISYTGKIQLGPYQLTEKIRWYQYKEIIWYNPIQVDHSGYLYCHSAVLLAIAVQTGYTKYNLISVCNKKSYVTEQCGNTSHIKIIIGGHLQKVSQSTKR
jgi:hypothetical protein